MMYLVNEALLRLIKPLIALILRQVALCHVGFLASIMHQHVIPGLISGWPAFCDGLIPFIRP